MSKVLIPRARIVDGSLPSFCIVCGAEAPYRRYAGVAAPSLAWVLFSPLIGLVTFWTYILFTGGRGGTGGLPFFGRHRSYWARRAWLIVGGFAGLMIILVVGVLLTPPDRPGAAPRAALAFRSTGLLDARLLAGVPDPAPLSHAPDR